MENLTFSSSVNGGHLLPEIEKLLSSHQGQINPDINLHWKFCKPKLLPLKTFTIEKLEKLQSEAEDRLKQGESDQSFH